MAGVRGWKKALRNAVDSPWDSDIDPDTPECPGCGSSMDFHRHDDSGAHRKKNPEQLDSFMPWGRLPDFCKK